MNIFVSYRRESLEKVRAIVEFLQQRGHTVWAYYKDVPEALRADQDKRHTMKIEALDRADVVLVLVSSQFEQSHGMAREIIYAQSHGKPVLPVIIEPAELPYSLLGTPYLDISADFEAGLAQIAERIEQTSLTRRPEIVHNHADRRRRLAEKLDQEAPIERVFIAYSHRQRALAQQLYELLISHGKAVFYDQKLKAGASWRQTIQKALDDATHVLVIWTSDAAQSDEVEREVSYALAERKVIVPVLSKDIPRLPYHLHGLHYIVLEDDLTHIEEPLLQAIGQYAADEDIWR
ncbi:MAG TPA: toll/interleukin-1 receptor domain-containing protein [Spirillospora sp.]|nr:toll/interleukin-1 receptor domain-containing protein [Spirillospora sp.]